MLQQPSVLAAAGDVSEIFNSPVLWILAIGVFAVIFVQSFIYFRAASKAAPAAGLTQEELRQALRTGGIAAIGPSLAVVIVAIAFLALFGTPAVLVRIGLIGSAAYEAAAAGIAAGTVGAELGGETYTPEVFAIALFAMTVGGAMWMITTLIVTPLLTKSQASVAKLHPAVMTVIPTAAVLGAFMSLGVAEWPKSTNHIIVFMTSAVVMGICVFIARRFKKPWLTEWALGIAIIVALFVANVLV